jgi:hypothetical protein
MSVKDPGAGPSRPVVTLAAFYGAGGTVIGPRVAERLGVPFLDRGILTAVAKRLRVPEEAAAEYEEPPRRGVGRYLDSLGKVGISDATPMDNPEQDEHRYRAETEEFIASAAESGGVILGRGGQVVLRGRPGVLHVFLGGPPEACSASWPTVERAGARCRGRLAPLRPEAPQRRGRAANGTSGDPARAARAPARRARCRRRWSWRHGRRASRPVQAATTTATHPPPDNSS